MFWSSSKTKHKKEQQARQRAQGIRIENSSKKTTKKKSKKQQIERRSKKYKARSMHDFNEQNQSAKGVVIFFFIIVFLLGGIYALAWRQSNNEETHITTIQVKDIKHIDHSAIEQAVQDYLQQEWLFLPRKSYLLARESHIEEILHAQFLTLTNITVELKGQGITITAGERAPIALVCEDIFSPHHCYYIDNEGVVYQKAPLFSRGIYMRWQARQDVSTGVELFTQQDIIRMQLVQSQLAKKGLKPWAIKWNERSLDVHFDEIQNQKPGMYAHVKLLLREFRDIQINKEETTGVDILEWQPLQRLDNTLAAQPFINELNTQPQNLQAIDLQFDGKVFFTFKPDSEYMQEEQQEDLPIEEDAEIREDNVETQEESSEESESNSEEESSETAAEEETEESEIQNQISEEG